MIVVDNKGVEVARFHHEELSDARDGMTNLREAVQAARARDLQHYDPALNDVAS